MAGAAERIQEMLRTTLTGPGPGCESLADKFGALADPLHQAEVDDQCFGPLGEFCQWWFGLHGPTGERGSRWCS